jgi:hypothetical protein
VDTARREIVCFTVPVKDLYALRHPDEAMRPGRRRAQPDREPADFLHPIAVNAAPQGVRQQLRAEANTQDEPEVKLRARH